MKKFISYVLFFLSPFILVFGWVLVKDVFMVLGYQDYTKEHVVALNQGHVTTTTYENLREEQKYNAFIFGSSRSQAFHCDVWKNYLEEDKRPFHFDAMGEGIWGIAKKMEYIDSKGDSIKSALIVLDQILLDFVSNRQGHLHITKPSVSGESWYVYYKAFIMASVNLKFLASYFDYLIFKEFRPYMQKFLHGSKYPRKLNPINCDVIYGEEEEIKTDSLAYYKKMKDIFIGRKSGSDRSVLKPKAIDLLKSISFILKKHKTDYKVVLAPMYHQMENSDDCIDVLHEIFGKENVYNFSGKNEFTEPIGNYYETSHFRPHVANEIMKRIYSAN